MPLLTPLFSCASPSSFASSGFSVLVPTCFCFFVFSGGLFVFVSTHCNNDVVVDTGAVPTISAAIPELLFASSVQAVSTDSDVNVNFTDVSVAWLPGFVQDGDSFPDLVLGCSSCQTPSSEPGVIFGLDLGAKAQATRREKEGGGRGDTVRAERRETGRVGIKEEELGFERGRVATNEA